MTAECGVLYRSKKCIGIVKLAVACFISGGNAGSGWARRIMASVSASSDG
jgi:hypothetical protein